MTTEISASSSPRFAIWRTVGLAAAAGLSVYYTKLSLPTAFLLFISFIALPPLTARTRSRLRAAHVVAGLVVTVALVRFIIVEGARGVVGGGQTATEKAAVSKLRTVLFAQDAARRLAFRDPDGDGIGSAALLTELSGGLSVEGQTLNVLAPSFRNTQRTPIGPASLAGAYLVIVCLPKIGGELSAQPGAGFDYEAAERRFVAYAWPADWSHRLTRAFFLDEHENILTSPNLLPGKKREPRYAGPNHPPPCDSALRHRARDGWSVWRNKRPRESLPGANKG